MLAFERSVSVFGMRCWIFARNEQETDSMLKTTKSIFHREFLSIKIKKYSGAGSLFNTFNAITYES